MSLLSILVMGCVVRLGSLPPLADHRDVVFWGGDPSRHRECSYQSLRGEVMPTELRKVNRITKSAARFVG